MYLKLGRLSHVSFWSQAWTKFIFFSRSNSRFNNTSWVLPLCLPNTLPCLHW